MTTVLPQKTDVNTKIPNKLERTPNSDKYDIQKKIGIAVGTATATALTIGGICYYKGKPLNGEAKRLIDCLRDGWNKLVHNSSKDTAVSKPELSMTDDARRIYDDITRKTKPNITVSVQEDSPVLRSMAKYYQELENAKTISEFREIGGFKNGQAILNDGRKYSGYIKREGKDGKYTAMCRYKNGILVETKIDFQKDALVYVSKYDAAGRITERCEYLKDNYGNIYRLEGQKKYYIDLDGKHVREERYYDIDTRAMQKDPIVTVKTYKIGDTSVEERIVAKFDEIRTKTKAKDGSYTIEVTNLKKTGTSVVLKYDANKKFITKYTKDLSNGKIIEELIPFHEVYKGVNGEIKYEIKYNSNSSKVKEVIIHNPDGSISCSARLFPDGKIYSDWRGVKETIVLGDSAKLVNGDLFINYRRHNDWKVIKQENNNIIFKSTYEEIHYDPITKEITFPFNFHDSEEISEHLIKEFERICPDGDIARLWQEKTEALSKCILEKPDSALIKENIPFDERIAEY